jgi:hypothetical protein
LENPLKNRRKSPGPCRTLSLLETRVFAMAKMGRVSGFWRFLGKNLGTEQKLPYWEPTGENPWISGPEYI